MGQNTRQFLQIVLVTFAFTSIIAWTTPLELNSVVWAIRILSPIATAAAIFVVYKVWSLPGSYADNLRDIDGRFFERTGLCFAPRIEVEGNVAYFCFYFQNRYEREAIATLAAQPGMRSFRLSRAKLPTPSITVQCPGIGLGVARIPFAIPRKYQGQTLRIELGADVNYPKRRGKLQRRRAGIRAGSIANLSEGRRLLNAICGAVLFGIIHEEKPASIKITLPTSVVETLPACVKPRVELLWQPIGDDEGFMPPRAAA